ncbi:efflux RND transporter permease subunit [Corallincola spongiicola]|uniref:Efflux RND transporter permease subunit n=1 Tax=Corallincola spongiicola TaxID=2520508 RepID=A0ABY1WSU5_9GAMM|nr:efflux RND transporter permease subunit [Corallincola spongiicola]TAA47819.1 efflux RND transporter permease subunit [Corallincola spongiicola]
MDIARYSINTPVNTWLMILVCLIGGMVGLSNIGRLEDPAFTIKQAKVLTSYTGASAAKVEREITEPVEIAIQQMPQLRRVTSVSKPGQSEVTVEIKTNYDADKLPQIWDELRKRLSDMSGSLPNGAGKPKVVDDFGEVFGLYYALTAPDFTPYQLREFSRIIRRDLLMVPGVAKVEVNGVMQEQIVAEMDPNHIAGLGLSFPDVAALLQYNLRPFNSGRMLIEGNQVRIPIEAAKNHLQEIGNLMLAVPGSNATIRIQDFADLRLETKDVQPHLIRYQGDQAITLAVAAQNDVNIVEVGKAVQEQVKAVLARLPAGITLDAIYDQGKVVDESVDGFLLNLQLSVIVVTLTLCLFMGWRSGVVVGSILLMTVMGTIMTMWLFSLQLQRISLGAMVIAMGMLVDNAIVVAEGMMLRMQQGKSAREAASFIVKRTQWPLLGATVIGIAAFSGIGLSDDQTGEFLFSLFAVILISLILSWILAVTATPLFGSYFYKTENKGSQESFNSFLHKGYLAALRGALKFRWLTVAVLIAITAVAYANFGNVKKGFFPPSNTPIFYIHYWGPQNRDIRTTEAVMAEAEKVVMAGENVDSVSTFIGRGADRFTLTYAPESANESYGLFLVRMDSADNIDAFANTIADKLASLDPDADIYVKRIIFGPGSAAKIEARFSGPDATVLRQLGEQALALFRADGQVKDTRHNWREKVITMMPLYDEYNASVAGVTRADFADAVQYTTNGLQLGKLRDGDYDYPIVAKTPNSENATVDSLRDAQVWSAQQRRYIPLSQVMEKIQLASEDVLRQRRNRIRTISVLAEPAAHETAAAALTRLQPALEAIPLPDGYKLEWGGEYESSRDAQKALGGGLPVSFLIMLLVTVLLFGKVRQPLIIWLIVPMAVVGVVSGLIATDMPFGFMSLLGFLSLFGMMIKNAIVLIEEIDLQIEEGKPVREAIVDASLSRLRPVSLAAITTILGMAPLLFDAFFADMSVTIMGGLTFATLLTLIAVPVLYSIMFRVSFRVKNLPQATTK